MNKYEVIERLKLYYFMPSYWRKQQRKCYLCNGKHAKDKPVQYGIAFDKEKKLFHFRCLNKYMSDNKQKNN